MLAILIPKTEDGRVLFAVPWHGRLVVGTTDTPVDEASLEPRALPEEIDFIFAEVTRYLARDPKRSDVLACMPGCARREATRRRQQRLRCRAITSSSFPIPASSPSPAGKWTTYRKMAEDVIDHAELSAISIIGSALLTNSPIHGSSTEQSVPSISMSMARTPQPFAISFLPTARSV